jgi:hypothetical protein
MRPPPPPPPPPPPTTSLICRKRQWALPTKLTHKTDLSEARFATAHDPALRALRRPTLDEEQ